MDWVQKLKWSSILRGSFITFFQTILNAVSTYYLFTKLNSRLELVSGAHFLHYSPWNFCLYNTINWSSFNIRSFLLLRAFNNFVFLNSSLDTRWNYTPYDLPSISFSSKLSNSRPEKVEGKRDVKKKQNALRTNGVFSEFFVQTPYFSRFAKSYMWTDFNFTHSFWCFYSWLWTSKFVNELIFNTVAPNC